ncbi:MAG TPA: hypothetical protein GXZ97_00675 [Hydrogenispora sp.]|jgi:hypothetical protein|nr:hypothetical protein [Hydrogenispora sp.]
MTKKLVKTSFLLFILLLVMGTPSVTAAARLKAVRVGEGFDGTLSEKVWVENTTAYEFSLHNGLKIRLLAGFDQQQLYLGFLVKDPFLTFQDDFSLDFQGSDHLRLTFWPEGSNPVTLYLLPSSKIKEPLVNISGASWRQTSVMVRSVPVQHGYFLTAAIDLNNLGLSSRYGEIPVQVGVNEISSKGEAKTYWLFGTGPQDFATLVLSP